jgi:hypothetical protein
MCNIEAIECYSTFAIDTWIHNCVLSYQRSEGVYYKEKFSKPKSYFITRSLLPNIKPKH